MIYVLVLVLAWLVAPRKRVAGFGGGSRRLRDVCVTFDVFFYLRIKNGAPNNTDITITINRRKNTLYRSCKKVISNSILSTQIFRSINASSIWGEDREG